MATETTKRILDNFAAFMDEAERLNPEAFAKARAERAELEALRKDAERYRWLRDDFSPMGLNIDGNHAWAYRRNATLKGPTLDAAIDAAIQAS